MNTSTRPAHTPSRTRTLTIRRLNANNLGRTRILRREHVPADTPQAMIAHVRELVGATLRPVTLTLNLDKQPARLLVSRPQESNGQVVAYLALQRSDLPAAVAWMLEDRQTFGLITKRRA